MEIAIKLGGEPSSGDICRNAHWHNISRRFSKHEDLMESCNSANTGV